MKQRQQEERIAALEEELGEALGDFRDCARAWGHVSYGRPARNMQPAHRLGWRLAAGWAVALLLAVITTGGVTVWRTHQTVAARHPVVRPAVVAPATAQTHAPAATAEKMEAPAADVADEDLLAKVDRDVARQTPRAMEPLAQLMDEDDAQ